MAALPRHRAQSHVQRTVQHEVDHQKPIDGRRHSGKMEEEKKRNDDAVQHADSSNHVGVGVVLEFVPLSSTRHLIWIVA